MIWAGLAYLALMSRKRFPHVRSKRHYCHPSWSLADRIAYYSKPEPLTGCHIWQVALLHGYGILRYRGRQTR